MKGAFVCLLTLGFVNSAFAEFTTYFDFSAWESDAGAFTTIDFTDYPPGTEITNQYADLGVVFPSDFDFVFSGGTYDDARLVNTLGEMWISFSEPQSGFGIEFPGIVSIQLFSRGELVFESPLYGDGPLFVGVFSEVTFDAAAVVAPGPFDAAVDNLYFSVPAPPAFATLAIAWLFSGRRRRRPSETSYRRSRFSTSCVPIHTFELLSMSTSSSDTL